MGERDQKTDLGDATATATATAPEAEYRAPGPSQAAIQRKLIQRKKVARAASAREQESVGIQPAARDDNGVAEGADHAVSAASSSSGTALPEPLMQKFEGSLGADLSSVRVHTGEASATANDAVGAKAYTTGNDIHFGGGHYDPSSPAGEHLLAHEVAHTVQQSGGAQRMQFKLEVSSPSDHLEHEADHAAHAMVRGDVASVSGGGGLIARDQDPKDLDPKQKGTWDPPHLFEGDGLVTATDRHNARCNLQCLQLTFKDMPDSGPMIQLIQAKIGAKLAALHDDATALTAAEASELGGIGMAAVGGYNVAMQQMRDTLQKSLSSATKPAGVDGMSDQAAEILRKAFHKDESTLAKAKEVNEKTHKVVETLNKMVGWAQKALGAIAKVEKWKEFAEKLEGLHEFGENALKVHEILSNLGNAVIALQASGDTSRTNAQQGAQGVSAGVSVVSAIIGAGSMIGLSCASAIGSVWTSMIVPETELAIKKLEKLDARAEDGAHEQMRHLFEDAVQSGGPPPNLSKVDLAQGWFAGGSAAGQGNLNYLWAAWKGQAPDNAPPEVAKFFYDNKGKMNAEHGESEKLDTEWHAFKANEVKNLKNWVMGHRDEVWAMFYGSLPHPAAVGGAEGGEDGFAARASDGRGVQAGAESLVSEASSSSGSELPGDLQTRFEAASSTDLSNVRVHTGPESAAAASAVGAKAYATGQDIHFGAGQYDPSSQAGQHLIAHEVAHTVQQGGGSPVRQNKLEVSAPGDAFEIEADRFADAAIGGGLTQPVSAQSTTIAREGEDEKVVPVGKWIDDNAAALRAAVVAKMLGVDIPTGSPYAKWGPPAAPLPQQVVGDIARFDDATLASVLHGEDFHAAVSRNANPNPTVEAAAGALVASFTTQVAASLRRIVSSYVVAWNQAAFAYESNTLKREMAPGESPPPPSGNSILASHPMDVHTKKVLLAAQGFLVVDFRKLRAELPAEAKPHDLAILRPIPAAQITLQTAGGKWNWVIVSGVVDPRPEEVAKTLFGGEHQAAFLTSAPPQFGFDPAGKLIEPFKTQYELNTKTETSADPKKNDSTKPQDPAANLPGGATTNQSALDQSKNLVGTGADQAAVVERLRLNGQIIDDCLPLATPLKLGAELAGVKKRVTDRIALLLTNSAENQANLPGWDADSARQRELLTKGANGLKLAAQQARAAGGGKSGGGKVEAGAQAASVVQMLMAPATALGRAWMDVIAVSDLPETAAAKLADATTREKLFPVEVTETILNYVRTLIEQTKASGAASKTIYGSMDGSVKKEEELRTKAVALRAAFETDPAKGQQLLAELQNDLDSLVMEVSLTNTVAQLDLLFAQLEEHRSSILEWIVNPVTIGKDSESGGHRRGNQARIKECMEWMEAFRSRVTTEVRTPFNEGTPAGMAKAKAAFESYKSDEVVTEQLEFAAAVIEDAEFVQAVTAIAAMLMIGIVSGGLGDLAAASVVGASEALVTVGSVAVTTGTVAGAFVESMTVSVLSAVISKEPTGLVTFAEEFLTNFAFAGVFKTVGANFAALKKAGAISEAEFKASQVASFAAMYTALTTTRCIQKNSEKKEHGGQGLTEAEVQEIAIQTAAELVGQAIAMHSLHHFCEALQTKLNGVRAFETQLAEINRMRAEVNADAKALADAAKSTPGAQLGPKLRQTVTKSNAELSAEEKFLGELDQVMNSPGSYKLFTAEEIASIHSALGDTKSQLYAQRKIALLSGKTAIAPNHYEIPQNQIREVITQVKEMGGWHQMEIVDEAGLKTVRFEPNRGAEAPPDGATGVLKFTEVSKAAAATPTDVTPEQWGSAYKSIAHGQAPRPTDIPPTPNNLQAQRKLESIGHDPQLEGGDLRELRNEFFKELAAKLDPTKPEADLDGKIGEVLKTVGADGKPKYLRRGAAVSAADVGKLGGLFRAVTFDTLIGNRMITEAYYESIIVGHESEGLPPSLDKVGWGHPKMNDVIALMRSKPPGAGDFDMSKMIEGRAGASGWWYAGADERGASTAAALSKALAASNMANGVVVFELPPDVAAGKTPADVSGGAKAKIVATKPTAFDGGMVNGSQFNANPDHNAPTGLTTPEPGTGQAPVREVNVPPVALSTAKWPPRVMP